MKTGPIVTAAVLILLSSCSFSGKPRSPYVEVCGDTLKVDTSVPGRDIEGFRGPVPLQVCVVAGKIADIRILDNSETPRYLQKASEGLLPQWKGLTVKKALKLAPDAVSGATWSSRAITDNMRIALEELSK